MAWVPCSPGLIVLCVLVVGLFSFIYFEEREENPKEYYILVVP
jgi:NADH-quinone oxidoreductase subunit N